MLEIKVNIEMTSPDLSAAISKLADALNGGVMAVPGSNETVIPVGTPMDVAKAVTTTPATVKSTSSATDNTQPAAPVSAPPVDLNTISRAGAGLVEQGKMAEILGILKKHGVEAVTQLKTDQYESFAADLRALGANI